MARARALSVTVSALVSSIFTLGGLGAIALLTESPAAAQAKPKKPAPVDPEASPLPAEPDGDKPAGGGAGTEVELGDDDAPSADPSGTNENPNAPRIDGEVVTAPVTPPPKRTGYPIEQVLRPITLPGFTSEVALDVHNTVSPFTTDSTLRARYGITRQAQIGLRYNIGGVFALGTDKSKFHTGKAVGVEGWFLVQDWVAAHLVVPVYLDPSAVGLTLGAPMKFRFGSQFAITALDNFIDIKLHKFAPSLTSEATNAKLAAALAVNTALPRGDLRFGAGIEYQIQRDLAFVGFLAAELPDFQSQGIQYPFEGTLQWSPKPRIDLSGRLGFDSLADSGTFGFRLTAAVRI